MKFFHTLVISFLRKYFCESFINNIIKFLITGPPSLELYNKAKDHLSEVLMWYKTLPPSCVRLGNNSLVIQQSNSQIYQIPKEGFQS